MTSENIIGTLTAGDDVTLEEAEAFCRILHADAAISFEGGLVRVAAVRSRQVS